MMTQTTLRSVPSASRGIVLAILIGLSLGACSSPLANRDPVGELFPAVRGQSLAGDAVQVPADFAGDPTLLIVGYVQEAQFDADRWLFGALQAETPVRLVELPTIAGLMPGMFAGTIDEGMRSGIPSEDWGAVVTVYDDADAIVALTGNTRPRNVRVLLLDENGTVRWFHDRGYSAGKMLELDRLVRGMTGDRDP